MGDLSPQFHQWVAKSFQTLTKGTAVFVADIDGDALYEMYLAAFPEGTNRIFKTRAEHDCSMCKQFIRRAGAVITIEDGQVKTVWDQAATKAPAHYAEVAGTLRDVVRAAGVRDLFRVDLKEGAFGAKETRSQDKVTEKVLTWPHLHTGEIPRHLRAASPDAIKGAFRTTAQVFERGLVELTPAAVEQVLELVKANALYRGAEKKAVLEEFQRLQKEYNNKNDVEKKLFVWANAESPASRFRSDVIGTLVQDLSEGRDLESAVQSFETKVAPTNYKRSTALITPMMVKQAMKTIEELGLESALERRFAVIGDVSVNDVKWVDGAVKPLMKGGLGDLLMNHAKTGRISSTKDEERAEDISLDDFVARVLPETQNMEVFLKGTHLGNLMSLTAPVHPEPKQLFRWTNDFSWAYSGNVADSIAERVKKAGGKVEGAALRISLSWYNYDDLDLHVHEPPGRGMNAGTQHIYYGNKRGWTGGVLDVDMNAGRGTTREPVENTVWMSKPHDGAYRVVVNNYRTQETNDPGFVVEIECGGKLSHYSYNKIVRLRQDVAVVTLYMKDGLIDRVEAGDPGITSAIISQEKWGLKTEQYVKVNSVMFSPNFWGDNAVGNKHTFFILDGAKNNEDARGFFNEYLHSRLEPHRKVFEVIGDKTKCQPTEGQLSGLGFSSTKKTNFLVRVQQGKKQRIFNVNVT